MNPVLPERVPSQAKVIIPVPSPASTEQANPTGFVGTTGHFTESGSDGGRFIAIGHRN